ncbi:MAG TPA: DUF1232 domain-containing protein [Longimicrobiales bacterium]
MKKKGYRFGRGRVRQAATSLLRQAPAVLRLFGRLMTDPRVSIIDRGLVAAVIAYVVSPWDLVPDFLAVIGVVDDLFLMGVALDRLLMRAPVDAVEEHWEGTQQGLESLTAELQAIGEALPAPIRSVLYGRVAENQWGHGFESAEVYEADDVEWPAAERARHAGRGASRPRRGREVASFDDVVEDGGEEDEYGAERVDRYRNRL